MKKIIGILTLTLCMAVAFAQSADHMVLVKPAGDVAQAQSKIAAIVGTNVRARVMQTTGEIVFAETSSFADLKKKIEAALPGSTVRELSMADFNKLRGN